MSFVIDETLLVLGEKIAEFVFAQWRADWAKRRDKIPIADLVVERADSRRTKRRTQLQVSLIADEIAEHLSNTFGVIFERLQDDVPTVSAEIGSMFGEAQLSLNSILAVDVDPRELASALQGLRPNATDSLSHSGKALFELVLTECCEYVVEIVVEMPAFHSAVGQVLLKRTTGIIDLINDVLDNMPISKVGLTSDTTQETLFEREYRREIARKLDTLELFGLGTPERLRQYPLSVAYISLSMSTPKAASSKIIQEAGASTSYMRVEDALAGGHRYLIRGEAGSGKTTLLRWIAVQCARKKLTGALARWNRHSPFYLSLRRYADDPLPTPAHFVDAITPTLTPPSRWTEAKLRFGSAIVLIDGLDELPTGRRDDVREWLTEMCAVYPASAFVVTTRPPAVALGWLDEDDFTEFELQPMTMDDTRAFIAHWHEAAKMHNSSTRMSLHLLEARLRDEITETPHIAALATTPLMCAMLCALNRDRPSGLPRYRTELYRIALEMILERRDRERRIPSDLLPLDLTEIRALLQDLAYWLVLNTQAQVSKDYAVQRVHHRLEALPHVELSAEAAIEGLLLRTGLLREPIVGSLDFVHKTFQEYFAAAEVVDQNHISLALANADSDAWQEVIILVAGLAGVTQRESLIQGLLQRANEGGAPRLKLAAVECLGASQQMSPALVDESRKAILSLLPPRTTEQARALAAGGEDIIPSLRNYAQAEETIAIACARCLGFIATHDAMYALSEFAHSATVQLASVLIEMWGRFDAMEYAERVLAEVPINNGTLIVRDAALLGPSTRLRNCKKLDCRFAGYLPNEVHLEEVDSVVDISAYDAGAITDLRSLSRQRQLRTVKFDYAYELGELSPAAAFPCLTEVHIGVAPELRQMDAFPHLTTLSLPNAPKVDLTRVLRELPELRTLVFSRGTNGSAEHVIAPDDRTDDSHLNDTRLNEGRPPAMPDLESIECLSELTRLELGWITELVDVTTIQSLHQIETLAIRYCGRLSDVDAVSRLPRLSELDLTCCSTIRSLPAFVSPHTLTRLNLGGCASLKDLAHENVESLRHLSLAGTALTTFGILAQAALLETLDLSGTGITDLEILRALPRLKELKIVRCKAVNDFSALCDMPLEILDVRECAVNKSWDGLVMPNLTVLRADELNIAGALHAMALPMLEQVEVEGDSSEAERLVGDDVRVLMLPRRHALESVRALA